jgi:hypothetical protein
MRRLGGEYCAARGDAYGRFSCGASSDAFILLRVPLH